MMNAPLAGSRTGASRFFRAFYDLQAHKSPHRRPEHSRLWSRAFTIAHHRHYRQRPAAVQHGSETWQHAGLPGRVRRFSRSTVTHSGSGVESPHDDRLGQNSDRSINISTPISAWLGFRKSLVLSRIRALTHCDCDITSNERHIRIRGDATQVKEAAWYVETLLRHYRKHGRSLKPEKVLSSLVDLDRTLVDESIASSEASREVVDKTKAAHLDGSGSDQFKNLMRAIPSPVFLITGSTADPMVEPDDPARLAHYRGMTVSSFTTVTMAPSSIVSFNIKRPSSTLEALRLRGCFNVFVLANNSIGAAIADAFTKRYQDPSMPFKDLMNDHMCMISQDQGGPFLTGKGIITCLRCTIMNDSCVDVGDHTIVTAAVNKVGEINGDSEAEMFGLSYAQRSFRAVGDKIEPARTSAEPLKKA